MAQVEDGSAVLSSSDAYTVTTSVAPVAINLDGDGVITTPADGVTQYAQSQATLEDGSKILIADVAFEYSAITDTTAWTQTNTTADTTYVSTVDITIPASLEELKVI